jgi:hypothetical protein
MIVEKKIKQSDIRPQDNNRGMEIKDDVVREKILGIVGKFLRQ